MDVEDSTRRTTSCEGPKTFYFLLMSSRGNSNALAIRPRDPTHQGIMNFCREGRNHVDDALLYLSDSACGESCIPAALPRDKRQPPHPVESKAASPSCLKAAFRGVLTFVLRNDHDHMVF